MTAGTLLEHPSVPSFRIKVDKVHNGTVTARALDVATGLPTTVTFERSLTTLSEWRVLA